MARLLYRLDGVTISVMHNPLGPANHVIVQRGSDVAVVQGDENDIVGKPRIDYSRVYNVIPPDVTEDQAVAIFLAGWRRGRETCGGSYDDAGIGNLSNRLAVLYGVDDRTVEFMNWFNRHYSGTRLRFEPLP